MLKQVFFLFFFISLYLLGLGQEKVFLKVQHKKKFKIVLESNPTTGYSWYWLNKKTVKNLDSIKHRFVERSEEKKVGVPGKEIWIFYAKNKGKDSILLGYLRPWEENPINEKKFIVDIK